MTEVNWNDWSVQVGRDGFPVIRLITSDEQRDFELRCWTADEMEKLEAEITKLEQEAIQARIARFVDRDLQRWRSFREADRIENDRWLKFWTAVLKKKSNGKKKAKTHRKAKETRKGAPRRKHRSRSRKNRRLQR